MLFTFSKCTCIHTFKGNAPVTLDFLALPSNILYCQDFGAEKLVKMHSQNIASRFHSQKHTIASLLIIISWKALHHLDENNFYTRITVSRRNLQKTK